MEKGAYSFSCEPFFKQVDDCFLRPTNKQDEIKKARKASEEFESSFGVSRKRDARRSKKIGVVAARVPDSPEVELEISLSASPEITFFD